MATVSRRAFNGGLIGALTAIAHWRSHAFAAAAQSSGLKDVLADRFRMGTALSNATLAGKNAQLLELIKREFNSVTAENGMKWMWIEPAEGQWNFTFGDRLVEIGTQNGMEVVGHTLVWHSQTARDVFRSAEGKPVSRERLAKKMESHIQTMVDRYRGRVHIWDVVNEAIEEGDRGWRRSPWFETLGAEFMERAFHLAHEADPKAHLIYNDYNMHDPGKRKFLSELIADYRRRGVPIHGVGLQGHIGLDYPDLREMERSIQIHAEQGMRIHVTELDVDVLPQPSRPISAEISQTAQYQEQLNPYTAGIPKSVLQEQAQRFRQLFELLIKHHEKIDRVTTWGTHDGESWKNDFPIRGRTNYPLLFDRTLQPKPAYHSIRALPG